MTTMRIETDLVLPHVHKRVSFGFEGRVLGIVGASGAGKSTFLMVMAGLRKPSRGVLVVNGKTWDDVSRGIHLKPWERGAVLVPQDALLFPHMTVQDNVEYGGDRHTDPLVALFRMEEFLEKYPQALSGGEQQRAALARALNAEPRVLLLDEPYSALNRELKEEIKAGLHAWTEHHEIPYVIVSHDREMIDELCDMVIDFDTLEDE